MIFELFSYMTNQLRILGLLLFFVSGTGITTMHAENPEPAKASKKKDSQVVFSFSTKKNEKKIYLGNNTAPAPKPASEIGKQGLKLQNNITLKASLERFNLEVNLAKLLLDKWLLDPKAMQKIALKKEKGKADYENPNVVLASYALIGFFQAIKNLYVQFPVQEGSIDIGQIASKLAFRFNSGEMLDSMEFHITMGDSLEKISKNYLNMFSVIVRAQNDYFACELGLARNRLSQKSKDEFNTNPYLINQYIIPNLTIELGKGIFSLINLDLIIKKIAFKYVGPKEFYSYAQDKFNKKVPELQLNIEFKPISITEFLTCKIKPSMARKHKKEGNDYVGETAIKLPISLEYDNITFSLEIGTVLNGFKPKQTNIGFQIGAKKVLWEPKDEQDQDNDEVD